MRDLVTPAGGVGGYALAPRRAEVDVVAFARVVTPRGAERGGVVVVLCCRVGIGFVAERGRVGHGHVGCSEREQEEEEAEAEAGGVVHCCGKRRRWEGRVGACLLWRGCLEEYKRGSGGATCDVSRGLIGRTEEFHSCFFLTFLRRLGLCGRDSARRGRRERANDAEGGTQACVGIGTVQTQEQVVVWAWRLGWRGIDCAGYLKRRMNNCAGLLHVE